MSARQGQQSFRKNIVKRAGCCEATLCNKINICDAAHIKPHNQCTEEEKMDPNNALCLIATVHKAFDYGYITFDVDGALLTSSLLTSTDIECFGLTGKERIKLPGCRPEYLKFHRENIFKE